MKRIRISVKVLEQAPDGTFIAVEIGGKRYVLDSSVR